MTFESPSVLKDPVIGKYDWLTLDGCEYITEPGQPALPYKVVIFKANLGYEISGVAVDISSEDLDGSYNIMPALEPSQFGTEGGLTDPDPAIYSSDEPRPGNWYSYDVKIGIDSETMTRIKYVIVHLYPLQYEPASGKIVRAKEATVEVNYSGSPIIRPFSSTDLLIITSPLLETQADSLAAFRNAMGISTIVKTTTDAAITGQPGVDLQEQIRNYIKSISGLKYVIIFGDADQVPVRMAYIPEPPELGDVPTDLYYADLQYSWGPDGSGNWGDPANVTIDGIPDLYIGRLPASNTTEATTLVDKIINYEQNTSLTDTWFKKMLLLGADRESEILKDYIENNYIPADYIVTKLYATYGNLTVANVTDEINAGYGLVNFAGHADWDCWCFPGVDYYNGDALGQTNGSKLPVIFALACSTSEFDNHDCIGEAFMLNANGGAIAYFGPTRTAYGYVDSDITTGLAGELDWRFSEVFFGGERVAGKLWGRAITDYVIAHPPTTLEEGSYYDWWTVAEYGSPFMDPTQIIGGGKSITIETSNLVSSYPATISYVEGGVVKTANTYGTWSGTPDYNTSLSISNPVSVSASERYHTQDITSWTVTTWATHSVTYYHQFWITIVTTGLSPAHPATITFVQYGTTSNPTTSANWSDWADASSTLSIESSVAGGWIGDWSTGDTTSWTVDSAISATINYQRSYLMVYIIAGVGAATIIGAAVVVILVIRRRRGARI